MRSATTEDSAVWTAVRVSMRWDAARRRIVGGTQLKAAEGRLLSLLEDEHPRTLREIADELQLEQSTVNRQVNAAVAEGLVTRSRGEEDAAYRVEATAQGREKFDADVTRHIELQARALADIPADQHDTFLRHLATYVDALNAAADPGTT